jgi:hypothetical protein
MPELKGEKERGTKGMRKEEDERERYARERKLNCISGKNLFPLIFVPNK